MSAGSQYGRFGLKHTSDRRQCFAPISIFHTLSDIRQDDSRRWRRESPNQLPGTRLLQLERALLEPSFLGRSLVEVCDVPVERLGWWVGHWSPLTPAKPLRQEKALLAEAGVAVGFQIGHDLRGGSVGWTQLILSGQVLEDLDYGDGLR